MPNFSNACVFEVTFIDQVKAITEDKDAEIVLYGSSDRTMDGIKAADVINMCGFCVKHGDGKKWYLASGGWILTPAIASRWE